MRPFVFRPAAALDLRRREHDAAAAQLARVQQERDAAADALTAAQAAIARAEDAFRGELARGTTAETLTRHRTWIVGLRIPVHRCRRALDDRQLAVEAATRHVQFARRRLRALERLRDRAWRSYEDGRRRMEIAAMDAIAIARFARQPERRQTEDHE